MSHRNKQTPSLVYQVKIALQKKGCFGESKHAAKAAGTVKDGIYSYSTLQTYIKHCCYFTFWARQQAPDGRKPHSLDDCRPYAAAWIQARIDAGLSPYTIKMEISALCKLYGCSSAELRLPSAPKRHRADITRSRQSVTRDKDFSVSRNAAIINFCRCTGLRRRELAAIKGTDLVWSADGKAYIHVSNGKGGRQRDVPVLDNNLEVIAIMQAAGDNLVWPRIPSHMDVHSYRADYATALYHRTARDVQGLSKDEIYRCRGDRAGVVYDRAAMLYVSRALGHNRISVIAGHYLQV